MGVPPDDAELAEFAADFKPVFDQRWWLLAGVNGEPVRHLLEPARLDAGCRWFKGRMGPLQITLPPARQALRPRGPNHDRRARLSGASAWAETLAATLYRYYEERGLKSAFSAFVDEDNLASRRLAESFGGRGRNLYTAYEKLLA